MLSIYYTYIIEVPMAYNHLWFLLLYKKLKKLILGKFIHFNENGSFPIDSR